MARQLYESGAPGELRLNLHAGQWEAWQSTARWILVLAGTQSGKTSFGPLWLWREMQQCGPGDYLVATPTFPLLELKALPEFRRLFEDMLGLGRYTGSPVRRFRLSDQGAARLWGTVQAQPTNVFFGYAADPESLESLTGKGAWLDEAGQKKFKLGAWQAVKRRLAINRGRALLTTTPYYLGWLKQQLYDKRNSDPEIAVINFASTMNPVFPAAEFAAAQRTMPAWQFNMFYRGLFERPAGLIYDVFDPARDTCPPFAIPKEWPRYWGGDFGGVHTAFMKYAEDPGTGQLFAYAEYLAGGRTAKEHTEALLAGEPGLPRRCVGGSKSEDQWRNEFAAAGLPIAPPGFSDVEIGISRVYAVKKQRHLTVFNDLLGYLDQNAGYSRVVDAQGEPTAEIEDKAIYHFLDAERYIIGDIRPGPVQEADFMAGGSLLWPA